MRTVNDWVKNVVSVRPIASSGATHNGAAIDTLGFNSLLADVEIGAATGSPTSFTVDAKLQESTNGSSGWADISGASITQQTAESKSAQIALEGLGVGTRKRYVRVVITTAFVGGTTPTIPVASVVELGNPYRKPVGNAGLVGA